jgi:hypothetical protein
VQQKAWRNGNFESLGGDQINNQIVAGWRVSNWVSLPTDSHDSATVVNRNIEAGRGTNSHVHSVSPSHYARFAAHPAPCLIKRCSTSGRTGQ